MLEILLKIRYFYPLSAKLTKWPNTLKQFVNNLLTNCLSVFGHFVGLTLKGLKKGYQEILKLTLFFLSNPINFNGQSYEKQKGPGTSDQLLFRLQIKFREISLLVYII